MNLNLILQRIENNLRAFGLPEDDIKELVDKYKKEYFQQILDDKKYGYSDHFNKKEQEND